MIPDFQPPDTDFCNEFWHIKKPKLIPDSYIDANPHMKKYQYGPPSDDSE